MLDADLKARWIAALRSGEFKQNRLSLRNSSGGKPPSFCCLGILACIQGARWEDDNRPIINGERANHKKGGWLDERFSGGLSLDVQNTLSHMNDGGKSFLQIADYIEEHL